VDDFFLYHTIQLCYNLCQTFDTDSNMKEEFRLLKAELNRIWPPKSATYLLNPEYDDLIYYNDIAEGIALHILRGDIVDNIWIRMRPTGWDLEKPDFVDIMLEPGYVVKMNRGIIYINSNKYEVLGFICEGLIKHFELYS